MLIHIRRIFALALLAIGAQAQAASTQNLLAKVDLREVPLAEACRLIAEPSGLNIVPSQAASARTVSLYLRQVDARTAVDALAQAHQLAVIEQGGILRLVTLEERTQSKTAVGDERTAYFTVLYPNVFDVAYAVRNLFGRRVQLRVSEGDQQMLLDLQDRFTRFDLVNSRTQGLGTQAFGSQGFNTQGFGGQGFNANGTGFPGQSGFNNSFLNSNQDVRTLDGAAGRDGGDVSASGASEPASGIPIHVTAARRQNKLVVRTADLEALGQIEELVRELDVPTAMVLLEVRILSVDLNDGQTSFFEYQFADGKFGGDFSTGAIQPAVPPALGVGGTGTTPGNFIFQFVDAQFGARMQLLERESRVKLVSTPILLTANNEVSRLFVGREVPLNRGFSGGQVVSNQTSTSTVSGTSAIEFRPVGTTLLITPNINADRTVTLRILQENSEVRSTAQILVPSGNEFVQQQVGVVSSQTITGTIVAKDELAVAFGGLIEEGTEVVNEQVPLLGDIPLVGKLFSRDSDKQTRREIVVVVRPFVFATPADQDARTRQLLEGIERDRAKLEASATTTSPEGLEILGLPKR
jgi:general secretion pathway protein D